MKLKVLLIDDEASKIFTKYFTTASAIELVAHDYLEHHEAVEKAVHGPFDAILMDGSLGEWVMFTGIDIVRELRGKSVTTRIVMFSSSDQLNWQGVEAGADAIWGKDRLGSDGWERSLCEALTP